MAAVSDALLQTIIELQTLNSLRDAVLGGGTSLALRYNHRQSIDIDLFFSSQIGKAGFDAIEAEVNKHFTSNRIFGLTRPCDEDDQFVFLRFFIVTNGENIKVEILQNINLLQEPDLLKGVRVATVLDVALMKLQAVSNRASQKDVYDLDYITEDVPLFELMKQLETKQRLFNQEQHKTIFDMDEEVSPVNEPQRLLTFENNRVDKRKPGHGDHRIVNMGSSKNWLVARSSYRKKIREYFGLIDVDFPSFN